MIEGEQRQTLIEALKAHIAEFTRRQSILTGHPVGFTGSLIKEIPQERMEAIMRGDSLSGIEAARIMVYLDDYAIAQQKEIDDLFRKARAYGFKLVIPLSETQPVGGSGK